MPLRAILIDRQLLIQHGNWNQPLEACLKDMEDQGLMVVDISKFPACKDNRTETPSWLRRRGLSVRDCMVIADCELTVQQAWSMGAAVLGYEPENCRRISSHLDILVQGFQEIDRCFLERMYQRFFRIPWTILETERCLVREMTMEDLAALYELYRPREITRYLEGLDSDRQKEAARLQAYIQHMYRFYGYGMWVVVEKSTGELIGRAGFEHRTVTGELVPELGYLIAAGKQHQGYGTEVCRAILDYGWRELGFTTVYCRIHRENLPSVRLAEKLGFTCEGNVKEDGKELLRYKMLKRY